jgi:NAD(P)-dependent dehydrogenase (short-subunit alcohol dehydrogenase family)
MSTTTQAPKQIDPSASLHAETLGQARSHGRLKGRRIIVVGAGQRTIVDGDPPVGNGRAMSVLFAREGAYVACIDINKKAAEDTVAQITSEGGNAFADIVDVADASAIAPSVERCAKKLGGLDGLALNVGISWGVILRQCADAVPRCRPHGGYRAQLVCIRRIAHGLPRTMAMPTSSASAITGTATK